MFESPKSPRASGVEPKTLAILKDVSSLGFRLPLITCDNAERLMCANRAISVWLRPSLNTATCSAVLFFITLNIA